MRLAWYAGASTALAGAVIASAFHQRANFYSSMVHIAQSSLSLMIIVNLVFLFYGSFMYGLQRLCFGQLRPVEIEQLYEKAWFAVTETCLAMTIFREEVGAFFLVMFTALVTGKVWGWIGEGRVEVLEQQPPANPRLFHTRLTISLLCSVIYDCWLLHYTVWTVIQQARPTMMVMFLFEFAVLTICSFHTAFRYMISLVEQRVIKMQTTQRLADRRRQIREQRAEILRQRETEGVTEGEGQAAEALPSEDDIDEMDIEVPGWEAKGQWVLSLDLATDFLKLGIFSAFFCVLFTFYGLPIHIMRDLFLTTRSFVKRLGALLRYRQAVRDMNKYPDATAQDLSQEDTCIICREEMRPWDPNDPEQVERYRPKKLPCGHILHFGCLKSWLERQQVCPTCRSSVVLETPGQARNGDAMVFRLGLNFPNGGGNQQQPPANGAAPGGGQAPPAGQNDQQNGRNGGGVRMFNLGPLRLGFAQGGVQNIQEMAQRLGMPADVANPPATTQTPAVQAAGGGRNTGQLLNDINTQVNDISQRLQEVSQLVQRDFQNMQNADIQLQTLNHLLYEAMRLNQAQNLTQQPNGAHPGPAVINPTRPGPPLPPGQQPLPPFQLPGPQAPRQVFTHQFHPHGHARFNPPVTVTRHGGADYASAIPAGSPDLPEGVVIPPGWSLLPLQRLEGGPGMVPPMANSQMTISVQAQPPAALNHTNLSEMLQTVQQQAGQRSPSNPPRSVPNSAAAPTSAAALTATHPEPEPEPALNAAGDARDRHDAYPSPRASEEPHVTAPTPVMPNWGGSAQLFGGRGPFDQHQATGGSSDGGTAEAAGSKPSTQPAASGSDASNGVAENGSVSKGKGKAATVEEAPGDEGDH